MKTSNKGIELIKRHEGFAPSAYKCPAGIWTIGYGHTSGVKSGDVITAMQGEKHLRYDLTYAEAVVNGHNMVLTQNQFDALVSFVFNVGSGNFMSSTLLRKARVDVSDPSISDEFLRWNKARVNGILKVLPGLVKRRLEESKIYFEP